MISVLAAVALTTHAALERQMVELGIPRHEVVVAFGPTPAIEGLAAEAVADAGDDTARAHQIYDAILALKRAGLIVGDRDNAPKARLPRPAGVLVSPAGERRAGCYELTALFVAAARSVGLDAVGVEREQATGTGQIGHIMAGVRLGARLTIFDLQNETRGTLARVRELSDQELAAHHYNHLAVARYLRGEIRLALRAIDWACALAPSNPSFINNRGTILEREGEPILALAEVAHAVELAPAVPLFRYQLGRLYLATGQVDLAIATLHDALQIRPRYGLARRDLGWAYVMAGRPGLAEGELERARAIVDTPDTDLYFALLVAARGEMDQAVAVVGAGLEKDPDDQLLLALRTILTGEEGGDPAAIVRLRGILEHVRAGGRDTALKRRETWQP